MSGVHLAWILFGLYLAVTFWLAYLGHKRTKNFEDFAVGGRSMGPGLTGMTLGACLASTATFVVNPGFVYAYGLPALLALTIPLFAGVFAGLALMSKGFRKYGKTATTLPLWIGERYQSQGLRALFALLCLLNVFYVVLIVVGAAFVMQASMGVPYVWALRIVVGVVFSYVLLGGTYAHAYTNTAQGFVMLVVAAIIFVVALESIGDPSEALATLRAQDPNLVALTNPQSPFYRHWVEVLVCPFVIGVALVAQPHLLLKTLYLKRTRDLATFGAVGFGCFVVFSLVLFAGLAARMDFGPGVAQDLAMPRWLATAFSPTLGAVVSVAILAAAMSTLDGLLVAVSAIVGVDLVAHPWIAPRFGAKDEPARQVLALSAGRITVLALGGVAYFISGWFDPASQVAGKSSGAALIGVFGTLGTYALFVATLPAVLYGIRDRVAPAWSIALASILGVSLHLGLFLGEVTINTGLTACAGLLISLPLPGLVLLLTPAAAPKLEAIKEMAAAEASPSQPAASAPESDCFTTSGRLVAASA